MEHLPGKGTLTKALLGSVEGHQQVSFALGLQEAAYRDVSKKGYLINHVQQAASGQVISAHLDIQLHYTVALLWVLRLHPALLARC